jgi:hypothetical protein
MLLYFAWVEEDEVDFLPEHQRIDEHVVSIEVVHEEGAFAVATVVIKNPRVGFLHASRKQWAWLSDEDEGLFFGRLVAIPTDINKEAVTLEFQARPKTFQDQKEAVAEGLRTLPTFDPVWFTPEAQADPDTVLEARSEMWHIDRVTGIVTTSNILIGEDGTQDFLPIEIPYDSVEITLAQVPARSIDVTGEISWAQGVSGTIDMGQFLIDTYAGQSLLQAWPKPDTNIGGGWFAADGTTIVDNRNIDTTDTLTTSISWSNNASQHNNGDTMSMSISSTRPNLQGTGTDIELPLTLHTNSAEGEVKTESTSLLVPEWSFTATLVLGYDTSRARKESITFRISANFQPIVTLPGDEDVQSLSISGGDVGIATLIPGFDYDFEVPIGDVSNRSYFTTERGLKSLEWLILRARAQLELSGRAVEVEAAIPYARAKQLSCRMNGRIHDRRLPGGIATGKIVKYGFRADGSSGERIGSVTIGAAIGYGGTVTEVVGEPDYCAADYCDADYQFYTGSTIVLDDNVGYSPPVFANGTDDGLAFPLTRTAVKECEIIGDVEQQRAFITSLAKTPDLVGLGGQLLEDLRTQIANRSQTLPKQLDDGLSTIGHYLSLRLPNLESGPFDNVYAVDLTLVELPKGIDLEAAPS